MKRKTGKDPAAVFMLIIYGMLSAALFALLLLCGTLYSSFLKSEKENFSVRTNLSYIETKLLACGEKDGICIKDNMITIREDEEYETRIYEKDGALCEELSKIGSPLSSSPQKITDTSDFSVKMLSENLLELSANGMSAYIYLRCGEVESP